jgi:S-DNA-T family DNA segregation ATPase FtsK/SpoIIIE
VYDTPDPTRRPGRARRPRPTRQLTRLAWHYRSELAPCYLALGLLAAGAVLHAARPDWWLAVGLTGPAGAGAVWRWGQRLGLDRPIERAYATGVLSASSAWLAAATAIGPGRSPLPAVLATGTLTGAVPWWAHRRRRAKVKVVRVAQRWDEHAAAAGLVGATLGQVKVDPGGHGWTAPLTLRPGLTIDDVTSKVGALESALDLRRNSVRLDEDPGRARRVWLRVIERDPHATSVPWPGPRIDTIARPVLLGPYEDGTPALLPLYGQCVLVAGLRGSGKSGVLNVLIGNLAACEDVVLWGLDLKHGLELGPWTPVFDRIAATLDDAERLLAAAERVMGAHGELLGHASTGRGGAKEWQPTPTRPALVIVIDEQGRLRESKTAIGRLETIATLGRALGVWLVSATQYPTVEVLGSSELRSQYTAHVLLRIQRRQHVDVVLGDGAARDGWRADRISAGKPGTLYLRAPGAEAPRLARAFEVTSPMVDRVVAAYRHDRPQLDPTAAAAAAEPLVLLAGGAAGDRDPSEARGELDASPPLRAAPPPAGDQSATHPATVPLPPAAPELAKLIDALRAAGERGARVSELQYATGMGRSWIYNQLNTLGEQGLAAQAEARGRWKLTKPPASEPAPEPGERTGPKAPEPSTDDRP